MSPVRWLRFTAAGGSVLVALCAGQAAGIPTIALMLAPGVVVPLGVALALDDGTSADQRDRAPETLSRWHAHLRRAVLVAAPLGAAGGVLGWLFPPGDPRAVAAAALHALACALYGLSGVARLARRWKDRLRPLQELPFDVGLLFLPVAAVWFLASRAGRPLAGFEEPVVTFTAAHFHFAGFAAPTILGGVGRLLGTPPRPRALYATAAAVVCAGVPMTAIGIATNHAVEAVSAVLLASGMLCASVLLVAFAARRAARTSYLAAALFVVSGGTLLLTMSLAATFALTSSAGRGSSLAGTVPLQTMIDWHGGANAIGFAFAGILALTVLAIRRPLRP